MDATLFGYVTFDGRENANVQLEGYVTYEQKEGVNAKLEAYVTYDKSDGISSQISAYVTFAPAEAVDVELNFDTKRVASNAKQLKADTSRKTQSQIVTEFDTKRETRYIFNIQGDTRRILNIQAEEIHIESSTKRDVFRTVDISGETKRYLTRTEDLSGDTKRTLKIKEVIKADTKRVMSVRVSLTANSKRNVCKMFSLYADTFRLLPRKILLSSDTKRNVKAIVKAINDTARKILHVLGELKSSGVQTISLDLQTGTLSDSFTLVGINKIYPKDTVEGVLLDFPFHFQAEETREEGILFTVNKTSYDSDVMRYILVNYKTNSSEKKEYWNREKIQSDDVHAESHSRHMAEALGLKFHWLANDFVPNQDFSNVETTYQSFLSSLFAWTNDIPRKKYIVFIRNKDELYFLQRGFETGNINLDEYKWHNRPVYERKMLRTTWMKSTDGDINEGEGGGSGVKGGHIYFPGAPPDPLPPSGDGINDTREEVPRGDGRTDNRIRYTERTNPDGSVTRTDYEYFDTGRNYLIRQITEVTKKPTSIDPMTGIVVQGFRSERITKYTYLQGGWRHCEVYENKVKVAESEDHQGESEEPEEPEEETNTASNSDRVRAGDEGNEFTDTQMGLALGGSWIKQGPKGNSFLNDKDCPVKDEGTAQMYFQELEWMNGAIEETATLSITAPVRNGIVADEDNHVFDFFDTYTLNGNVYFLESNSISLTPRSLKQNLKLIRWYK